MAKHKMVCAGLVLATVLGPSILSSADTWAAASACLPAEGLAEEGFIASESEFEYVIQEGIADVKVANDFTIGCQPTIMSESLKIDLNGKTITANVPWALDIETAGKTLTIEDSGSGGKIDFNDAGIWVEGGANLTIRSGTVDVSAGRGRGIVMRDGKLTLEGGTISANNGISNGSYYPTIVALNGTTTSTSIEISGGVISATNGTALSLQNAVNVEMTDGSIVGGDTGVLLDNGARFTMDGGTITASTWVVTAFDDTEFVMNGGTLAATGPDSIGISGNGTSNPEAANYGGNAKLTLNGGTINSNDLGVYAPQVNGLTTLGDGLTINAAKCGVEVRAGTLNVNGATINVDENAEYVFNPNGNGSTASGVGIAVAQHTTTQAIAANVTSGNFTAPVAFAEANPQHNPGDAIEKVNLAISGGNFVATNGEPIVASEDVAGFITGGTYSKAPEDKYVADGKFVYSSWDEQNNRGVFTVADNPTIAGLQDSVYYVQLNGNGTDLNRTLLPEVPGNFINVSAIGENSVCDEHGMSCLYAYDGKLFAHGRAVPGEYQAEYTLVDGTKGTFTAVVYYMYDSGNAVQGAGVGDYEYYYINTSDNVTVSIADESIAEFEERTMQSGDHTWVNTLIHGLKVGQTEIRYTLSDGTLLRTVALNVYDIETNLKKAQAVGSSQTFTFAPSEGYTVGNVGAFAWGRMGSGAQIGEPVTYKDNKDGSYTLTVNSMPMVEKYDCDDNGDNCVETGEFEPCPYMSVVIDLKDEEGNYYYKEYAITIFELAVADEASETEEEILENEVVLQKNIATLVAEVIEKQDEAGDNSLTVTLDNGAVVEISDVAAFVEAINNGETIEAVLVEPKELKESEVGFNTSAQMMLTMGSGKAGHRFVDISVEIKAGGKTVGHMTELEDPLMVTVSVSDDADVPAGYVRTYFVVRYHNGKAEKVNNVKYDRLKKAVAFPSDRFSTYLIAYTDEPDGEQPIASDEETDGSTTGGESDIEAANTGTFTSEGGSAVSDIVVFVVIMSVVLVVSSVYRSASRRNQRKNAQIKLTK